MTCLSSLYDIPEDERSNVIELAVARRRLDDKEWLRHHMLKRCAVLNITPNTFAIACHAAWDARDAGANPELALQSGMDYATKNQIPRNAGPPKGAA